jgi:hypothetical protein
MGEVPVPFQKEQETSFDHFRRLMSFQLTTRPNLDATVLLTACGGLIFGAFLARTIGALIGFFAGAAIPLAGEMLSRWLHARKQAE